METIRDDLKALLAPTAACNLPVPRLHLVWVDADEEPESGSDWHIRVCHYLMVLPVGRWDIRNMKAQPVDDESDGYTAAVLGTTRVRSGRKLIDLEAPYRDGAHAKWDSQQLGWPVYVSSGADYRRAT